jgi:sugar (pentulose or hexulose) kinase
VTKSAILVVDIGKTAAKASLCAPDGAIIARRERANGIIEKDGLRVLDAAGIEAWLETSLGDLNRMARASGLRPDAIVPVGHGAAAVIVREGALAAPPLDYEQPLPAARLAAYRAGRDPFAATGSPALPDGLNLGAQLDCLETLAPGLFASGSEIIPWAQYWAWLLSGVAASEVSSLGCHTDLWRPFEGRPSHLADRRGWAARLAPLRPAGDVLGPIRRDWAERTGLPPSTRILCGVHDSNAALLAARGFDEMKDRDSTLLSTGTWFVAMRSPAAGTRTSLEGLEEKRDCLVNVDVAGGPVPSARFMGGREIQLVMAPDGLQIDDLALQAEMIASVPETAAAEAMIIPSMVAGVGPFPDAVGQWRDRPASAMARAASAALYAALVADVSLDLVGALNAILVEGRFARSQVFVRSLAALRPDAEILIADGQLDLAFGACRLADPDLPPPCKLTRVEPIACDLSAYRSAWRERATCAGSGS